ncbi:hypothetical protein Pmar_PMAR027271 [Perkinsus marinus ATCC 50983]|uniref:Uncharacterized protein n=1 Tax=Perkinsus marinus (strain ATCC 50983 / TXsc) TaxID=423536 RepID=C5LX08_PERM5|nr:hypothetical protein Pmar_PMAR027271 [Perkinsus marinus ATCC 50983]EEQ98786.1 hypothetical protein Pmar_PMAR027271 [Perkinsus marinus ATCC 50983]|eukprot:XP_002766069.1 hypothetical protein Pmar_PMAR027271 [Perkinsus marinus ATCC 50983]
MNLQGGVIEQLLLSSKSRRKSALKKVPCVPYMAGNGSNSSNSGTVRLGKTGVEYVDDCF